MLGVEDRMRNSRMEGTDMSFVVIVEPEEVNADSICAILESVDRDFEYELTASPEHAIEIVESRKVDVFISSLDLAVMTGAELFTMIEMISPDTIRVAMTSPDKVVSTIACMNQCKTYKVIIKPCRVADDLLSPINASIAYKRVCEKMKKEEEDVNLGLFATEGDLKKLETSWRERLLTYRRMQSVIERVITTNLENGGMEPPMEAALKQWFGWLLETYVSTLIDSDGRYETCKAGLQSEYHHPDEGKIFQMKKNTKEAVEPTQMNEMAFMLNMVLEAYRVCTGTYKIAAMIEDTEKAYVLRIASPKMEESPDFVQKNPEIRKAVWKAAEEAIAAFDYKFYTICRDKEQIISIALRKKQ